jgi:hypothetical protein
MVAEDPQPAGGPSASSGRPPEAAARPAGAVPAAPKARPDPRPSRVALGASTIAAVSLMAAGLVRSPVPPVEGAEDDTALEALTTEVIATARPEVRVKHRTVYVQLKRGQKAPKGAKVIEGKAPPPRVVVTRIRSKPATTRQVRSKPRRVTRTRQSGG